MYNVYYIIVYVYVEYDRCEESYISIDGHTNASALRVRWEKFLFGTSYVCW